MSIEIFFCYAHEDEDALKELIVHLGVLKRQGFLNMWYDREISSGSEWAKEIDKHLNAAHIILLLVSQYFMASDYCYLVQMQKAIERHERGEARVIPIILRPVWRHSPSFKRCQLIPNQSLVPVGIAAMKLFSILQKVFVKWLKNYYQALSFSRNDANEGRYSWR